MNSGKSNIKWGHSPDTLLEVSLPTTKLEKNEVSTYASDPQFKHTLSAQQVDFPAWEYKSEGTESFLILSDLLLGFFPWADTDNSSRPHLAEHLISAQTVNLLN